MNDKTKMILGILAAALGIWLLTRQPEKKAGPVSPDKPDDDDKSDDDPFVPPKLPDVDVDTDEVDDDKRDLPLVIPDDEDDGTPVGPVGPVNPWMPDTERKEPTRFEDLDLKDTPTQGAWYQVKRNDNLSKICSKAGLVSGSMTQGKAWRRLVRHPWNAWAASLPMNQPSQTVTGELEIQLVERYPNPGWHVSQLPRASGQFPVLYIPTAVELAAVEV